MNLGYFEYSLNNFDVGLKYMRHALKYWGMLASGDKHPESASADVSHMRDSNSPGFNLCVNA